MKTGMVLPGDELATSEEYIPGPGTYERDGMIYAAVAGKPSFNESDMTVCVTAAQRTAVLSAGDIVLGEVTNVSNTIANVSISGLSNSRERWFSGETGAIHISKASDSYTDDMRKEFKAGDLVRVKVVQAAPSMQLTTREPELGVLKARCGRCRSFLQNRSGKLQCPDCERQEHRKLAADFARYTPSYIE
jgi:exosome complex component CSL4